MWEIGFGVRKMAIILVLAGGMLGFAAALIGYFALNLGLLWALAVWSGTGLLAAGAALGLLLLPRRQMDPARASHA